MNYIYRVRSLCIAVLVLALSGCLKSSDVSGTLGSEIPTHHNPGSAHFGVQLGAITHATGGDNSLQEFCNGVTVDTSGNVYCAGETRGAFGEANAGSADAFVMKLDSSGAVQWITQLGATTHGAGGDNSQYDSCLAVSVDGSGNVYCAGETQGSLGEANGGDVDAFVMKLNSSGAVQWITQLGAVTSVPGGDTSHFDECLSVAVDTTGNVYCGGITTGALGEANGGVAVSNSFVMKLNSAGAIQWIRQLGAVSAAAGGANYCHGVAEDGSGNVFCGGLTTGALGEAAGGGIDAFVMKLNSSGAIQWITQLGATTHGPGGDNSQSEYCQSIAVDASGNAYCGGVTYGALGEAPGGNGDAFVMKVNASGAVDWITQLGATTHGAGGDNSQFEMCFGVAVAATGDVYCAGATEGNMGEAQGGGSGDVFVMKLDSNGALRWLTQVGAVTKWTGGDNSQYDGCYAMALDSSNRVYCAGETDGSMIEAEGGGNNGDAFILRLESSGAF